jgi:hypothetical protein
VSSMTMIHDFTTINDLTVIMMMAKTRRYDDIMRWMILSVATIMIGCRRDPPTLFTGFPSFPASSSKFVVKEPKVAKRLRDPSVVTPGVVEFRAVCARLSLPLPDVSDLEYWCCEARQIDDRLKPLLKGKGQPRQFAELPAWYLDFLRTSPLFSRRFFTGKPVWLQREESA